MSSNFFTEKRAHELQTFASAAAAPAAEPRGRSDSTFWLMCAYAQLLLQRTCTPRAQPMCGHRQRGVGGTRCGHQEERPVAYNFSSRTSRKLPRWFRATPPWTKRWRAAPAASMPRAQCLYTRDCFCYLVRGRAADTHTYITTDDRKTKIEDMVANRHRGVVGMCFLRHRQHDEPLFRDQGIRYPAEYPVVLVPSCEGRTPPQMSR